jgi:hypothetical protein
MALPRTADDDHRPVVLAQLAAALDLGTALPWSIAPAARVAPDQHTGIGLMNIVGLAGRLGCWATNRWWHGPDAGL